MFRDMIRLGHPAPEVSEIPGPFVRTALAGEHIDEAWLTFQSRLRPPAAARDLGILLLVNCLAKQRWLDVRTAMPLLQLPEPEAVAVIGELRTVTVGDQPAVVEVAGVPADAGPAWCFSAAAQSALHEEYAASSRLQPEPTKEQIILSWIKHRGRISTTELGSILGLRPTNLSRLLKKLEQEGLIKPGRENRLGAGFFYIPA